MSIFHVPISRSYIFDSLLEKLTYVTRVTATRSDLIYGAGVSTVMPFHQMQFVKEFFAQEYGKAFFHYIFNPEESDNVDVYTAYQMGVEMADAISSFGGHFQVIMAVHTDKSYSHLHFIANNIDWCSGRRFDLDKKNLYLLKLLLSNIANSFGVSSIRCFSSTENDDN